MRKNLKYLLCLSFLFCAVAAAQAPVQHGITKTRGRMVNGELVPGKGLEGVSVTIEERQLVSDEDGHFSFPVTSGNYTILSVKKNGYELIDSDIRNRSTRYSPNPLFLVMETPEQRRMDLLDAEKNIRRNLRRQLQEREDEIETLKISQQEKDSLLRMLYGHQGDNEKLISEMAKRYASLDYDAMDEFYRKVSSWIEEGKLVSADSLLRSRGNLNTQVSAILKQGREIQAREQMLEQAKAVHRSDIEDVARRCFNFAEIFNIRHQKDSAAHYLLMRASLDTTNIEWQRDAGLYTLEYMADYSLAQVYLSRSLRQAFLQNGPSDEPVMRALFDMGTLNMVKGEYDQARAFFNQAISSCKDWEDGYHPEAASYYNSLGYIFQGQGKYKEALDYFLKALKECNRYPELTDEKNTYYKHAGDAYAALAQYDLEGELFIRALSAINDGITVDDSEIARCYTNVGLLYRRLGKSNECLEYLEKALSIYKRIYGEKHPDTASCYNNIGLILSETGNTSRALECYEKALNIEQEVYGPVHVEIARAMGNIGTIYYKQGDLDKALDYYEKGLHILEKSLGTTHDGMGYFYNNIGLIYYNKGDFEKAREYYDKFFSISVHSLGYVTPETAIMYYNFALSLYYQGDYWLALEFFSRALSIYERTVGRSHPDVARALLYQGDSYSQLRKYKEAVNSYLTAQPVIEKTKGATSVEAFDLYNKTASAYLALEDYSRALEYYKKSLSVSEQVFGVDHANTSAIKDNIDYIESIRSNERSGQER